MGDTEEKIDRFTSAPESSAQPSSSTLARGPDRLDRLLDRVDQMYTMLDSYVQHTATQFAYIQGQITALSSQIKDLSMAQGSDSKSDQFQHLWPFRSKGGENFKGELWKSLHSVRGSIDLVLETLIFGSHRMFTFSFYNYFFTAFV